MVLRGNPRPGRLWRVGIEHPFQHDRLAWVLELTDAAVATSGTYARGHHVFDPHTGTPVTDLVSVTVVGADLGLVDGYATAALAMGERGLGWLAAQPDCACAVVTSDGRAFRSANLPVATAVGGAAPATVAEASADTVALTGPAGAVRPAWPSPASG
jgi:thiamine biosynthesis lipoprotein